MPLSVYHQMRQPPANNNCQVRHIKCSHICVPQPQQQHKQHHQQQQQQQLSSALLTTCLCPAGLTLQDDAATCAGNTTNDNVEDNFNTTEENNVDTISKSEIVEVASSNNNHILAPILGVVGVLIILLGLIVSIQDLHIVYHIMKNLSTNC